MLQPARQKHGVDDALVDVSCPWHCPLDHGNTLDICLVRTNRESAFEPNLTVLLLQPINSVPLSCSNNIVVAIFNY